jgi:ATP-dependent helicase/nuclease subunit A
VGRINGRAFSGQIDRLVVGEKDVLVVDYKTNRPPPRTMEDIPDDYLAQMAAYHRLLSILHAGKTVRCALLWTHIPQLMKLDEPALTRGAAILQRRLEQL